MTAIVAGQGLGLLNTSVGLLGGQGQLGVAGQGNSGEKVLVNAATGNLVVQQQDEWLVGVGPDVAISRTYNSLGTGTDDNGDNWRLGLNRVIKGLSGTINTAGSTITRVAEDGSETVYTYDTTKALYLSKDGGGSFDTLGYSAGVWTWTDGDTQTKEAYEAVSGTNARLKTITDVDGNKITLTYANATSYLITEIATASASAASNEKVTIVYDTVAGNTSNILSLTTTYFDPQGVAQSLKRVSYTYETYNTSASRLKTVTVDLKPVDAQATTTYVTTYTYIDTVSTKLASIGQKDGTKVSFTYDTSGRVQTFSHIGAGQTLTTTLAYDTVNGKTSVTDPLGLVTELSYSVPAGQNQRQLTQVKRPAVAGVSQTTQFNYDTNGNLTSVVDARGNATVYRYDANGNRTYERDATGSVVERTYSATNLLTQETTYTVVDPDGEGTGLPSGAQTTRYVYDAKGHLRFVVSPQKRVTEYKYNGLGQQTSATLYANATLGSEAITESALATWATAQDLTRTQRTDYSYNSRSQISRSTTYAAISSTGVGSSAINIDYIYDQAGNLLSRVDNAAQTTTYAYDGLNRLVQETNALGLKRSTIHVDFLGHVVASVDTNGQFLASTYNVLGQLIAVDRYTSMEATASSGTTTYAYDKLNRLRMVSTPSGEKTFYLYDEASRKVGEIDPTGALTQYIYNADNQLVQTRQWANKVSASTLAALAADPSSGALPANLASNNFTGWTRTVDGAATNFTNGSNFNPDWTLSGEPTLWLRQTGTEAISSTLGSANLAVAAGKTYEVSAYTGAHRATASLEVAFYNSSGVQIGTAVVPTGGVVTNASESAGGTTLAGYKRLWGKVTAPAGAAFARVVVRKAPTNAGQADSYLFVAHAYLGEAPATQSLASGFDVRPAADTANDRVSLNLYDLAGRLVKTIDAAGAVVKYTYDGTGRLTETLRQYIALTPAQLAAIQNSATEVLATDPNTIAPTHVSDRSEHRFYNADGLLEAQFDAAGAYLENTYDAAGRLTKTIRYANVLIGINVTPDMSVKPLVTATTPTSGSYIGLDPTRDQVTQYVYNNQGQLVGTLDAEGYYTRYAYDTVGNKSLALRYTNKLQGSFDGKTPPALLAVGTAAPGTGAYLYTSPADDHLTNYFYDELNRLSSTWSRPEWAGVGYEYDTAGNLIGQSKLLMGGLERTTQNRYDPLGRLTATLPAEASGRLRDWLLTNPSATPEQIAAQTEAFWATWGTQYTYDSDDRLLSVTQPDGIGGAGLKTYHYYDAAGRKTASINALGEVVQYKYNTFGELIAQTQVGKRLDATTLAGLAGGRDTAVASAIAALISATAGTANAASTSQWAYDQRGLLSSVTDALNNTSTRTYTAFGQLSQANDKVDASRTLVSKYYYDQVGRQTFVAQSGTGLATRFLDYAEYDAFGRVAYTYDADFASSSYAYDRLGRQIATQDTLGGTRQFTYDAFDRVLTSTDALGKTTTYAYDSVKLKQTVTTPEGVVTTTVRNDVGQVVSVTDGRGTVTAYTYNLDDQLIGTTATSGSTVLSTTSVAYDQAGRVFETKDARGIVTRTTYDAANRVLKRVVDPDGTGLKLTTEYRYDAKGQAVWVKDASGVWTKSEFDLKGQLKATVVDPTSIPNPAGSTTDFDNLVANAGGLNLRTEYTYDAQGHTLTVIEGAQTPAQARTTQYSYDVAGRRTSETVDPGTGKLNLTTTYTYDKKDNVVARTDANGKVTRYVYDSESRLAYTVDATGAVSYNEYDLNGRLARTTAYANRIELGATTINTVASPAFGLVVASSDITARLTKAATRDQATRYVYDKDGRLSDSIDALGFVTRRVYDANGQVTRLTRYAKAATSVPETAYAYNQISFGSAVVDELDANNQIEQTVYDALGRATWRIDALGYATQQGFDANGNVTQTTRYSAPLVFVTGTQKLLDQNKAPIVGSSTTAGDSTIAANAAKDRTTYTVYDAANRATFGIDAEKYVTQTTYDGLGRVKTTTRYAKVLVNAYVSGVAPQVLTAAPSSGTPSYVLKDAANDATTTYTYDKAGRLTDTQDAELNTTRNVYDAAGRITDITVAYGHATDASTTRYIYDAAGRVTDEVKAYGKPEQATTRYVLDALGQRIKVVNPRGIDAAEGTSAAAIAERVRILGGTTATRTTPPTKGSADHNTIVAAYTTAQEFDAAGRITTSTDPSGRTIKTEFDAFGNAVKITDPSGNAGYFYFDQLNQATWSVDPMGYAVQTEFNGFGQTTKITRYTAKVSGTLSTSAKLLAYDNQAAATAANASLYVLRTSGKDQVTQIDHDKLGQQTKITDAEGFFESMAYDGLGNKTSYTQKSSTATVNDPTRTGTYTYTYDRLGRVLTETAPETSAGQAIRTAYVYDARGNVTQKTEAQGLTEQRITRFKYDRLDQQVEQRGEAMSVYTVAGGVVNNVEPVETRSYDKRGNLIEVKNTVTGARELSYYDTLNRKVAAVNALGTLTTLTYNADGSQAGQRVYGDAITIPSTAGGSVPTPLAANAANYRETLFTYDPLGRQTSTTIVGVAVGSRDSGGSYNVSPAGNLTSTKAYDANGNVVQETDARGNATYHYYDKVGQKILTVDAERYVTAWTYDGAGRITSETRYARQLPTTTSVTVSSQVATLLAAVPASNDNRTTNLTYDRMGRLKQQQTLNVLVTTLNATTGAPTETSSTVTTLYSYNGLGQVVQKTDAALGVTDFTYDRMGRQTKQKDAAYTDYLGNSVRATTDTEYDGLSQVRRNIERGTNDTVETDDHITEYTYGKNGFQATEKDPSGTVMTFLVDSAGRITRKSVSRSDADASAASTDVTDYVYDLIGQQTQQLIKNTTSGGTTTTLQTSETRYSTFGEIIAKGTNGGWQEFSEFDKAGRMVRSNVGTGITKVYFYDENGNATLTVDSAGADLKSIALDQVRSQPNVNMTISVYDKRNQLTDTYQPTISEQTNILSVQQALTQQQSAQIGGGTASIGVAAGLGAGNAVTAPQTVGTVAVSRTGTASTSMRSTVILEPFVKSYYPSSIAHNLTINLPDTSAWGSGNLRVSVSIAPSVNGSTGYLGYTGDFDVPNGQTSATFSFTEYASFLDAPLQPGNRTYTYSIYKRTTGAADQYLGGFTGNLNPASTNGVTNTSSTTMGANLMHFGGQDTSATKLVLMTRIKDSGAAWTVTQVPQAQSGGQDILGKFALDWSSWQRGTYEFRYVAMKADNSVVNAQQGTMVLSDSTPSMSQTAMTIGGAGRAFLDSNGRINFTEQGPTAATLTVRYRHANTSETYTQVVLNPDALGGAGWFALSTSGLSGDYEYTIEAKNAAGVTINKGSSTFTAGNANKVNDPSGVSVQTNPIVSVGATAALVAGPVSATLNRSIHYVATGNKDVYKGIYTVNWASLALSLPDTSFLGSGNIRVSVQIEPTYFATFNLGPETPPGSGQYPSSSYVNTNTQFLNAYSQDFLLASTNGPQSPTLSIGFSGQNAIEVDVMTSPGMPKISYGIYKKLPSGEEIYLGGYSGEGVKGNDEAVQGNGSFDMREYSNSGTTALVPYARFTANPATATKLILLSRPAGTNSGWTVTSLPADTAPGSFKLDWSNWTRGNYEFREYALDAAGNVLNADGGTMALFNTGPSITKTTSLIGGAGRVFMSSTGKLNFTEQGATAQTLTVRYRAKGSANVWTTVATPLTPVSLGGSAVPGWFEFDPAAAGLSGAYEYVITAKDGTGKTLNQVAGSFISDDAGSLSDLTGYQDAPVMVHFTSQAASANSIKLSYRPASSTGAYTTVNLSKVGTGAFDWDTTGIYTGTTTGDFTYLYEAFDSNGILVNKAHGSVRLGATAQILSHVGDAAPTLLSFSPPSSSAIASTATQMVLQYRITNSGTAYTSITLTRTDTTKPFVWDASTVIAPGTAGNLDYSYTLKDAANAVLKSDDGNVITNSGSLQVGAAAASTQYVWSIVGTSSTGPFAIHRSQHTNAFGEVDQEIDGLSRVTDFTYNTMGKLLSKQDPQTTVTLENGFQKTMRPVTKYYLDALGRTVGIKDANGNTNTQSLLAASSDGQDRILTEFHADGGKKKSGYDIFGNVRTSTDEINRLTEYTYDKNDRIVRVDRPVRSDGKRSYDFFEYDAIGNRIAHTTSDNGTATLRDRTYFDAMGRIVKGISAAQRTTNISYVYDATILGIGGVAVGGWKKTVSDPNVGARQNQHDTSNSSLIQAMVDSTDVFGRLTKHTDMGGRTFTYTYNNAGWLMNQTSTNGQNITYSYYANGYQKSISDLVSGALTEYGYDVVGNRNYEGYSRLVPGSQVREYFQNTTIAYDELNRVKEIIDPTATIRYEYDANGNRRRVWSYYHDGIDGSPQTQDYWYKYDSMNRFTLTMGQFTGSRATVETDSAVRIQATGADAVTLTYDAAGQRKTAVYARDSHREDYTYTADGLLADTYFNLTSTGSIGTLRTSRVNDLMGRVTGYTEYAENGTTVTSTRSSMYDADGRLKSDTTDGTSTIYTLMADGTLENSAATTSGTTITTYYSYEWWDGSKQSTITLKGYNPALGSNNALWKEGVSHYTYNVNGHLVQAKDETGGRVFRYATNAEGLILMRDQMIGTAVDKRHSYYYVGGHSVGDVGNDGDAHLDYAQQLVQPGANTDPKSKYKNWTPIASANFDQNYQAISASYPGTTPGGYTVRTGDSLYGIAMSVWGDSTLWYLIAEANGLTGSSKLTAGQTLIIPNKVTNVHNTSATYRVYDAGAAIGDTMPTLPDAPPPPPPPKKKGCGGLGMIIMIVVAVVATVLTAGAALSVIAPGMTMATASFGAALAAGAIGGAVGSIASQLVGMAMGNVEKFSWSAVATGAIGGAVGAGITNVVGAAGSMGGAMLRAAAGNAISQGISVAVGLQQKFDWRGVAASAAGGALNFGLTTNNGVDIPANSVEGFTGRLAAGVLGGAARSLIYKQKPNWANIAAESFGSALGDALAASIQSADRPKVAPKKTFAEDAAARKNALNPFSRAISSPTANLVPLNERGLGGEDTAIGIGDNNAPSATPPEPVSATVPASTSPSGYIYGDANATVAQRLEALKTSIYADGCFTGRLPDVTGLTDPQKGELYSGLLLDTIDRMKEDTLYSTKTSPLNGMPDSMLEAYKNKEAVQLGMRVPTSLNANNGRGLFDDRMVVLQMQDDGSTKVLYEGAYNADPAGSYQEGNQYFGAGRSSKQAEGTYANNDKVLDIGRLRSGIYEFEWAKAKTSFGPEIYKNSSGDSYNILRSTQMEPADRYFDGTWNFDADSFLKNPSSSPFSTGKSMYEHRGYQTFTGSAGCQTFPAGKISDLANVLSNASAITKQNRFFYALRNM